MKSKKMILSEISVFSNDEPLIVRSSTLSEDNHTESSAGKYLSLLNIDSQNSNAIIHAVESVFESYGNPIDNDQVLVQKMLSGVKVSGVVMTRNHDNGAPCYVFNFDTSGSTESVTSGTEAELETYIVNRDYNREINSLPQSLNRLILSVEEIESITSNDALDIEFAITEDDAIHIFQIRPIVIKKRFKSHHDDKIFNAIKESKAFFDASQIAYPHILGSRTIMMPMLNF
jgi:glutamine kinase